MLQNNVTLLSALFLSGAATRDRSSKLNGQMFAFCVGIVLQPIKVRQQVIRIKKKRRDGSCSCHPTSFCFLDDESVVCLTNNTTDLYFNDGWEL